LIFDTDVLIACLRGDRDAAESVASHLERAVSIISVMEMLQGAKSKDELRRIRGFFPNHELEVIPINESISYLAANLIEEHTLSTGLQLGDALIAATARERSSGLVTGNVRHFRSIRRLEIKSFRPAHSSNPKR
jgi:predicted nucleic acid-binding protein